MNLWFRLLRLVIAIVLAKDRVEMPAGRSRIYFRVWPLDLDPSLHMNNGRYLTIMDLGRFDILGRPGLLMAIIRYRWTPIASSISIRYRREMRLFQRFRLETGIVAWDETNVVMEQIFTFAGGERDGEVSARALFKGGIYDRAARSFVPVSRLMQEIGFEAESPEPSPEVEAFLNADDHLKRAGGAPPRSPAA